MVINMAPEPLRGEVNAIVLSNLGNPTFTTSTSTYTIYGMKMPITSLAMQIEVAYDEVYELLGSGAVVESSNYNKIKLFMADYSTLRVLNILQGTAITTHFNYSAGGLNIQKPVIGMMESMIAQYKSQVMSSKKKLLTRAIITTGATVSPGSSDLSLAIPNEEEPEGSGISVISYDQKNL